MRSAAWGVRVVLVGAAAGVALAGCGSGEPDPPAEPEGTVTLEQTDGSGNPVDAGEGDFVFGLGRESIAESVQKALGQEQTGAEWEGGTLVIAREGDAGARMAGHTECRVASELVGEGYFVVVEFPNGRIDCADLAAG